MGSLLLGCGSAFDKEMTWSNYSKWLTSKRESFVKTKEVNGLKITGEYLPADFLAYQEYKSTLTHGQQPNYDTIKKEYACGLSFKVSLKTEEITNLLQYQVVDYMQYKERINTLNFDIAEFIQLKIGGENYKPSLSIFEGQNELSNQVTFHLVFTPDEYNCGDFNDNVEQMKLTFQDPYWDTGVNHFAFTIEEITNLPKLLVDKA
ncbi:MAG: hypothetical protein AAFX87_20640 [Bacteroidota bacterium]